MVSYTIPVMAGDGVGPEVVAEGRKVLEAAARRFGFALDWLEMPYGAEHFLKTGQVLPDEALAEMAKHRAIFLGAVGDPRVEPGILEMGIVLKIRFNFDQYVNLRPIILFEGVPCPLRFKKAGDIDLIMIRENTEDFYLGLGARLKPGVKRERLSLVRRLYRLDLDLTASLEGDEVGFNLGVISRRGAARVIRYGFETARRTGRNKVTCVDKANVIPQMYGLWREAAQEVAGDYPDVALEFVFADAITMWLVKNPERFQVVVAPNLFGDIITDLSAVIGGGLGLCPGGNINPEGVSLFEPMHGSAPKYKGRNIVNPLATIWAGALMLDFLGQEEAGRAVLEAMVQVLKEGRFLTPDLGGRATTTQVGDAVARAVLNDE